MSNSYSILRVEDPEVGYRARLVYTRDMPLRSWMTGARFDKQPPEPIVLKLRGTDEEGWVLGDLWLTPITVMSRRLHQALLQAGVDNLDTYAVEMHDPVSGTVHTDFVAFNLVGKLAAADENKTRGALMFRLADSVNAILVQSSVRNAIEAAGINTLTFLEPEDWSG
jgi:hypothetical protein